MFTTLLAAAWATCVARAEDSPYLDDPIIYPPESVDTFYARIAHPAMSDVHIDWGDLDITEQ